MSETNGYHERLAQEKRLFDEYVCVHDLPDIFHYWSNKYLKTFINGFGYENIDDFFVQEIARTPRREGRGLRIASVGCGDCAIEAGIATGLRRMGVADFRMVCLDISDAALQRGRGHVRAAGVEEHFEMVVHDFNQGLPDGVFDVVMANQSLHHVAELERLFADIGRQLSPGGCLLVSDMIGRNGHMRWPEAHALVDEVWKWMPEPYRFNRQLQREQPQFLDWDCSTEGFEGVRAQEVLPLLLDRFEPRVFLAWGNIIDVFIDRGLGHNFHRQNEWDLNFIDQIHAIDHAAIERGEITPTHLLAKFQNEPGDCIRWPDRDPRLSVRVPDPVPLVPEPQETPPAGLEAPSRAPRALPLPRPLKDALRRIPGLEGLYRRIRGLD